MVKRTAGLTSEEFLARVSHAPRATDDDVSITTDGRRLATKADVLAWLESLDAETNEVDATHP